MSTQRHKIITHDSDTQSKTRYYEKGRDFFINTEVEAPLIPGSRGHASFVAPRITKRTSENMKKR